MAILVIAYPADICMSSQKDRYRWRDGQLCWERRCRCTKGLCWEHFHHSKFQFCLINLHQAFSDVVFWTAVYSWSSHPFISQHNPNSPWVSPVINLNIWQNATCAFSQLSDIIVIMDCYSKLKRCSFCFRLTAHTSWRNFFKSLVM